MKVEPTAETINNMAKTMRHFADSLDRTAAKMRETEDLGYASEALNTALDCLNNMRLDLLVVRPIREFQMREAERREGIQND